MLYDLYQRAHSQIESVLSNPQFDKFSLLDWQQPFSERSNEIRIDYAGWSNEPIFAGEEDYEIAQNKKAHTLTIFIRFYKQKNQEDIYFLVEEIEKKMVKENFTALNDSEKTIGQVFILSADEDHNLIETQEGGGTIQLGVQFTIYDNNL